MAKKTSKETTIQTVEETKETVETTTETQEATTVETTVTEPLTEETTTTETVEEKKEDVSDASEEPVVTEIPDTTTETEVPQYTITSDTPAEPTDKPAETDAPSTEGTEITDAGNTESTDKTPTDPVPPQDPVTEPVKEERPVASLSSVYPVRYHVTFSQKRMAFVRQMPIYNMLSTWCFNKSSFIGCTSKKDYEEIESCVKALPDDKVRVEGIMLSAAAKEQFLIKLKANTDYCVLKWGDKRK